jgi:glycyl-tRNA synthetase beta subunit
MIDQLSIKKLLENVNLNITLSSFYDKCACTVTFKNKQDKQAYAPVTFTIDINEINQLDEKLTEAFNVVLNNSNVIANTDMLIKSIQTKESEAKAKLEKTSNALKSKTTAKQQQQAVSTTTTVKNVADDDDDNDVEDVNKTNRISNDPPSLFD